jgi:hypothetical protein
MGLQQGFATSGMGFNDQVAQQQFKEADVCNGSKAEKLGMSTTGPVCPRKRNFQRPRVYEDTPEILKSHEQRDIQPAAAQPPRQPRR